MLTTKGRSQNMRHVHHQGKGSTELECIHYWGKRPIERWGMCIVADVNSRITDNRIITGERYRFHLQFEHIPFRKPMLVTWETPDSYNILSESLGERSEVTLRPPAPIPGLACGHQCWCSCRQPGQTTWAWHLQQEFRHESQEIQARAINEYVAVHFMHKTHNKTHPGYSLEKNNHFYISCVSNNPSSVAKDSHSSLWGENSGE